MTTAVASAPSTAAPVEVAPSPASAPAAVSDQPSWASEGGVNDFLRGATSDRPAAAPAPVTRMEPKPVETAAAAPAEPANAAAPAPVSAPTPETVTPAKPVVTPVAAAPAPGRKYAERFDTVEELEKSYAASGVEARRLLKAAADAQELVKAREATIAERAAELEALKLEKQLGPEVADPTPEEIAIWTPKQITDHAIAKLQRGQLKEKLEAQAKQAKTDSEASTAARTKEVHARMAHMSASKEDFPGFDEYMQTDESGKGPIADWMPLLPMLSGHPIAPLALFLIAHGHQALQKDKASAAAALKSKNEAAALAAASLPAAAGPGQSPVLQPEPAKPANPEDDTDAGHNERLIAAHNFGGKPILPYD